MLNLFCKIAITTIALLLGIENVVAKDNAAGTAIFVHGEVKVDRPPSIDLAKSDPVFEGDTVTTGPRSRAQVVMKDGARLALRAESSLVINEYFEQGEQREAANGSAFTTEKGSTVTTLLKGGLRTITGAIADADSSSHKTETPVATLGVRGTDYVVVYCDAVSSPCSGLPGESAPEDGLYVGVTSGHVIISNGAGRLELRDDQFGLVKGVGSVPRRLPGPPPVVFADAASGPETASTTSEAGGVPSTVTDDKFVARTQPTQTESSPVTPVVPPIDIDDDMGVSIVSGNPARNDVAIATGGNASVLANELVDLGFDAAGIELEAFLGGTRGGAAGNSSRFAIGSAGNFDVGFDQTSGLRWGRWAEGTASVSGVTNLLLTNQSLHWVVSPVTVITPVMPQTGTRRFDLIAGNTDPTDTQGNTGVLGSASLLANFSNQSVTTDVLVAIAGSIWTANGTGALTGNQFGGNFSTVRINNNSGAGGSFGGFFTDAANAAGMSYAMQNLNGNVVSGVVVFGAPQP